MIKLWPIFFTDVIKKEKRRILEYSSGKLVLSDFSNDATILMAIQQKNIFLGLAN